MHLRSEADETYEKSKRFVVIEQRCGEKRKKSGHYSTRRQTKSRKEEGDRRRTQRNDEGRETHTETKKRLAEYHHATPSGRITLAISASLTHSQSLTHSRFTDTVVDTCIHSRTSLTHSRFTHTVVDTCNHLRTSLCRCMSAPAAIRSLRQFSWPCSLTYMAAVLPDWTYRNANMQMYARNAHRKMIACTEMHAQRGCDGTRRGGNELVHTYKRKPNVFAGCNIRYPADAIWQEMERMSEGKREVARVIE